MLVKGIREEDFCQYIVPSMFVIFPKCTFKCEKECGKACCQNSELAKANTKDVPVERIVSHYMSNPITSALVCGGLEPFDSFEDLFDLIEKFREETSDTIVIYTGYYKEEIKGYISALQRFGNIIVKFGRFIPDIDSRFDPVLGVQLASFNQYAERIS